MLHLSTTERLFSNHKLLTPGVKGSVEPSRFKTALCRRLCSNAGWFGSTGFILSYLERSSGDLQGTLGNRPHALRG